MNDKKFSINEQIDYVEQNKELFFNVLNSFKELNVKMIDDFLLIDKPNINFYIAHYANLIANLLSKIPDENIRLKIIEALKETNKNMDNYDIKIKL